MHESGYAMIIGEWVAITNCDPRLAVVVEDGEELKLPLRGEGGLRLIHEVQTASAESMLEEREEGLAVRLLVK